MHRFGGNGCFRSQHYSSQSCSGFCAIAGERHWQGGCFSPALYFPCLVSSTSFRLCFRTWPITFSILPAWESLCLFLLVRYWRCGIGLNCHQGIVIPNCRNGSVTDLARCLSAR